MHGKLLKKPLRLPPPRLFTMAMGVLLLGFACVGPSRNTEPAAICVLLPPLLAYLKQGGLPWVQRIRLRVP